jgi:hypothetical protein
MSVLLPRFNDAVPRRLTAAMALGAVAFWLAGCAGGPPVPDWKMNAVGNLDRAVAAYNAGNDRVEASEFSRARSEMASTGQPVLVARAELIRCASRVASLVFDACTAFDALRQDAGAAELAYSNYLAGSLQAGDIALLPEAQRGAAAASAEGMAAAITAIADPHAKLVAAGVAMRVGRASPAVLALAAETASGQGWRRPLLAWLGVQAMRAEKSGDSAELQRLQRRMALVQEARR